ncbi:putative aminotransferase-like, plant mobile domain-containing protein [Medicago truncatula]|uniref:Putative aminotransferase-like, plant mobile domain-containing protein n=1 Tax=Medicago truncatula TaxID=3880 RepID=A0A396HNY6_MEDTR|nr:protein MAINTENANCE OF MERISTEMS-like [Medicago truncatula]RHN53594.1 putative aminotransferase-like, plant mobile domain-containing protein [Medicago truncatula]
MGWMGLAFLYEQLSLTSDSSMASCGGYMTFLVGWTLTHFSNIIPRIDDDAYDPAVSPLVIQWKPPRGFSNPGHYRSAIDSLDHSHVTWRPYERRRHITPFQDICWYSGWIMTGSDRMVHHLSERVLRKYGYVQTILRAPTDIELIAADDVAQDFTEFALHVLSHQDRGYMRWFIRVSHPIVNPPTTIPDYAAAAPPRPVPPYEEDIVEQQWARHPLDPYQIISNIRARVDGAMGHPVVFHNSEEVMRLMQGIQSEWSMLEQVPAPRRRSRNPRDGPV